jgi:hypothetical protein
MASLLPYASAGTSVHRGTDGIQIIIPFHISRIDAVFSSVVSLGLVGAFVVFGLWPRYLGGDDGVRARLVVLVIAGTLGMAYWSRMRTRNRAIELTLAAGVLASRTPSLRGYAFRKYALSDFSEAAVATDDGAGQIVLHGKDGRSEAIVLSGTDFRSEDLAFAVEVINEAMAATPT